ncbi:LysE family translocator [Polaromonas sp. YR568]|uniref:LysE family translocator n=1 Tax=Polaromonas sp. YR568 TaxID=1855301 RepID=UPI00398BCDFC
MVTASQLLPFLLTALLITITPGPDNLMVLGLGMSKGRRLGMTFGLGCASGCLSHTVLAVIGVSAIVAASPTAFLLLKWAGGAYLVWLGVRAIRHAGAGTAAAANSREGTARELFAKGLAVNAINPKVVLFFLSFLPQFVDQAQGHVEWQLGILGLVFTAQAAVVFGLLGYFAGTIGAWLTRTPRAAAWLDRVAGAVFVGLGARMIVSR